MTPLTLTWTSDETGTYLVTVDGVSAATGDCTASVPVINVLDQDDFFQGANSVQVTVTNTNGVGFDVTNVTRIGGPTSPGLCWGSPLVDYVPREEVGADPLANRLGRHMRQPQQGRNVFILSDNRVVEDRVDALDVIRVSLFGAAVGQHVSTGDAQLLIAAGYGTNLVVCAQPSSGWNLSGWNTTPWDS